MAKEKGLLLNIRGMVDKRLLEGLKNLQGVLGAFAEATKKLGEEDASKLLEGMASSLSSNVSATTSAIEDITEKTKDHLEGAGEAAEDFADKAEKAGEAQNVLASVLEMIKEYGGDFSKSVQDITEGLSQFQKSYLDKFAQFQDDLENMGSETSKIAKTIAEEMGKITGEGLGAEGRDELGLYEDALKVLANEMEETGAAQEKIENQARDLADQITKTAKMFKDEGVEGTEEWAKSLDMAGIRAELLRGNVLATADGLVPLNEQGRLAINIYEDWAQHLTILDEKFGAFIERFNELSKATGQGGVEEELDAMRDLAKQFGATNEVAEEYITRILLVKEGLEKMGKAAEDIGAEGLKEVVEKADVAGIVLETFRGNVDALTGKLKVLTEQGMRPFIEMTEDMAERLGILGESYERNKRLASSWGNEIDKLKKEGVSQKEIDRVEALGDEYGKLPEHVRTYLAAVRESETEQAKIRSLQLSQLEKIGDKGSDAYKEIEGSVTAATEPQYQLNEAMSKAARRLEKTTEIIDQFVAKMDQMGISHEQVKEAVSILSAVMEKETNAGLSAYEGLADKIVESVGQQIEAFAKQAEILAEQKEEYQDSGEVIQKFQSVLEDLLGGLKGLAGQGSDVSEVLEAVTARVKEAGEGAEGSEDAYKSLAEVLEGFKSISGLITGAFEAVFKEIAKFTGQGMDELEEFEERAIDAKKRIAETKTEAARAAKTDKKDSDKADDDSIGLDPDAFTGVTIEFFEELKEAAGKTTQEINQAKKEAIKYGNAVLGLARIIKKEGVEGTREWAEAITAQDIKLAEQSGGLQLVGDRVAGLNKKTAKQIGLSEEQTEAVLRNLGAMKKFTKEEQRLEQQIAEGNDAARDQLNALRYLGQVYGKTDEQAEMYIKRLQQIGPAVKVLQRKLNSFESGAFKGMADDVRSASAVIHTLEGNLKLTQKGFQFVNKKGILPFKNMTVEAAEALGMTGKAFLESRDDIDAFQKKLKKTSNLTEEQVAIIEHLADRFGAYIDNFNTYKKAAIDATTKIRGQVSALQYDMTKLGEGTAEYEELAEKIRRLEEPTYTVQKAMEQTYDTMAQGEKTIDGLESKLESMAAQDDRVVAAVRAMAKAFNTDAKSSLEMFKGLAVQVVRSIDRQVAGLHEQRDAVLQSIEATKKAGLSTKELESDLAELEKQIRDTASEESVIAKSFAAHADYAIGAADADKELVGARKRVSKAGMDLVPVLNALNDRYKDETLSKERLVSTIKKHANAVDEEKRKRIESAKAMKEQLANMEASEEGYDRLTAALENEQEALEAWSEEGARADEVMQRSIESFSDLTEAADSDVRAQSEWQKAREKSTRKSLEHADALEELGRIFGEDAAKVGRYNSAIGRVSSNFRKSQDAIKAQIEMLEVQKNQTGKSSKEVAKLDKQIFKLNQQLKKNADAFNIAEEAVDEYMEELDPSYRGMGMFTSRAMKMRKELGYLGGAFTMIGKRFKQFAAFTLAAAALTAIIQGIEQFIESVADFDQALHGMMAILEIGIDKVRVMGDVIKKTARETIFSATELGEGIQIIGQAGFNLAESMLALKGISQLATATQSEFGDVVELTTTAIRAFGLEATQTSKVADIFTNAINNAKVNIDKLKTAFNYVGAAGRQAGLNLNEVTGTLMVLADNGLKASTMGTGLRRVMLQMVNPSTKLKAAMAEVGLELDKVNPKTQGWIGALKNLAPILWDFETNTVDMGKAVAFFGTRAANALAALIEAVASGNSLQRAIDLTYEFGSAAQAAGTQAEGLSNKIKIMWQNIENLAIALGEAGLTDTIKFVVSSLTSLSQAAEKVVETIPGIIQWSMVALSIGGVGKVMMTVMKIARKLGFTFAKLAMAFTSPFAKAAYAASAMITLLIRVGTQYDRAAKKAGKAAEQFASHAIAARSWADALAKAAEEGRREFTNTVRRMREDEQAEDFVKFLEEDMGLTLESLKNHLDELAAATREYEKTSLTDAMVKDAEKLTAINEELLAADPALIKNRFAGGYDSLWEFIKKISQAPLHAMWRGITGVEYEEVMKQREIQLKRIRDRVLGLMDKEIVLSAEHLTAVFDNMYSGLLKPADFAKVRAMLLKELETMKKDADHQISEYQKVFAKLSPQIQEDLQAMTNIDQFGFEDKLTSIEEKVLAYQEYLEKEQNYHYKEAVKAAADYRNRMVQEKILEHQQIKAKADSYYEEMERKIDDHYAARREIVNQAYDWEIEILESRKPLRKSIKMRERALGEWKRVYDRAFGKLVDAEEGYLESVADINERLVEIHQNTAWRELNTRYLVLEKERERKDKLIAIAREEADKRIAVEKQRLQTRLSLERISATERESIVRNSRAAIDEIERGTLDDKEKVLNDWLSSLQSSYNYAITKEEAYADAIQSAQEDIAEIRKEGAESIKDNASTAEDALKKISRAGMTETELQADKLEEAQDKMSKAYHLIQSDVIENQDLAKQMAGEARDIFVELGVAAAKGEESALSQAEAERKVAKASDVVERAIKERTRLRVAEKEDALKHAQDMMDAYSRMAGDMAASIEVVRGSIRDLQNATIEPKYFEVDSGAKFELDRLAAIEEFDIHDKHYNVIAHQKTVAEDSGASHAFEGINPLTGNQYYGSTFAEGGEAPHPADLGAKAKGTDTIPAWLTPGEYVVKKSAVQKYGTMFLEALNKGKVAIDAVPKFTRGGFVGTLKSYVDVIPRYAKGGIAKATKSFVDVIPRYAKGGTVAPLRFAEGGAVPTSAGEGGLLRNIIESLRELRLANQEGFETLSAYLWNMTPPDLGQFLSTTNLGIKSLDSKLAYHSRLMIEGNQYLQRIDGSIQNLQHVMSAAAASGQGAGTINLNNYAGDARKLAFDIQRLQRLGQAPMLG